MALKEFTGELDAPDAPAVSLKPFDGRLDEEIQQPLPDGVTPSLAGAGRGSVNPPLAQPRRGTLGRAQPYGAGDERIQPPAPPPPGIGSVFDRMPQPEAPQGLSAQEMAEGSVAPATLARDRALAAYGDRSRSPSLKPLDPASAAGYAVRDVTDNPVARGAASGFSTLGQVGTGAVRLAADLFGADRVADFAAGASRTAGAVGNIATADLQGNEKLVADITASIENSLPSVALGMAGGPALRGLFVQSTLAEYSAGRDAGFDPGESLARAGIMGMAEALGERFGFPEQIKLLKGLTQRLPAGEAAKVFGALLRKEIPGEQLTTVMQFLADKLGPAALHPGAGIEDYLTAAGETLKVTIGQTAVMGGGPAAIIGTREQLQRADRATERSAMTQAERAAEDAGFLRPTEQRKAVLDRFDDFAATHGMPQSAVKVAREQAERKPIEEVPGFLKRFAAALSRRGLTGRPLDDAALAALDDPQEAQDTQPSVQQLTPEPSPNARRVLDDVSRETDVEPSGLADEAPPGLRALAAEDPLDTPLDQAAHAAATSPANDLPEPTEAQKAAGNYKVGRVRIAGLDISIENPQGSVRRGVGPDGTPWETTMQAHYGYVRGSRAGDGDHSDLFIKPGTPEDYAGPVFVIDQIDPETGRFDEHKAVLGAASEDEARALYLSNYDATGPQRIGAVTQLPIDAYRSWVRDGVKRKPLGDIDAARAGGNGDAGLADLGGGDRGAGVLQQQRADVAVDAGRADAPGAPGVPAAVVEPGGDAGRAAALKGKQGAVVPAGLSVTFGGKTYPVESLQDAQAKWIAFQEAAGAGVSEIGNGVVVVDGAGRKVGRISYNGRVWDANDKLVADAPNRQPMPEGVRPETAEGYLPPRETLEQVRARSEKAAAEATAQLEREKQAKARKPRKAPKAVRGSTALGALSDALRGLSPDLLADLSSKREVVRTGKTGKQTRYTTWDNPPVPGVGPLFRKGGSSDLTEIARVLEEEGFIPRGTLERDYLEARQLAQEIVQAELRQGGSTPRVGDADAIDAEARRRMEMAQGDPADQGGDDFIPDSADDRQDAGYDDLASEEERAAVERVLADLEAQGFDTESLREDAARQTADDSEKAYYARLLTLANFERQRIARAADAQGAGEQRGAEAAQGSAGPGAESGVQAAGPPSSTRGDRADRPDQAVRPEGQDEGLSLQAQSSADLQAKAEREGQADELDQRAQVDAEGDFFGLQQQNAPDQRKDTTTDLFGGPSVEDVQRAKKPGKAPAGPDLLGAGESEAAAEPAEHAAPADAKAPEAAKSRPTETIALRKRIAVLKALKNCLEG